MKFRVLFTILIVSLITSCSSRSEPLATREAQGQPPQEWSASANENSKAEQGSSFRLGSDGERNHLATFSFIDPDRDELTVNVANIYDPEPHGKDDEIHFRVIIQSDNPSAIPVGEIINIPSEKFPINIVVGAFCFCPRIPLSKGSGQHSLTGNVFFESFTEELVKGKVFLQMEGDIPYSSAEEPFYRDLWRVDTALELLIPSFVAVPRE